RRRSARGAPWPRRRAASSRRRRARAGGRRPWSTRARRPSRSSSQFVELAIDAYEARRELLLLALALLAAVGLLDRGQLAEQVLLLLLEALARHAAAAAERGVDAEREEQANRHRRREEAPRRIVVRQPVHAERDGAARRRARPAIEHELAPLQLAILGLQRVALDAHAVDLLGDEREIVERQRRVLIDLERRAVVRQREQHLHLGVARRDR